MQEQRLAQVNNHQSIMRLCGEYAAAAPEEPFPTTAALLEKLQEVLEKADVEVLAISLLSLRISISSGSLLPLCSIRNTLLLHCCHYCTRHCRKPI